MPFSASWNCKQTADQNVNKLISKMWKKESFKLTKDFENVFPINSLLQKVLTDDYEIEEENWISSMCIVKKRMKGNSFTNV